MNYLFYDCETGGLDYKKHTLLTAYFAVCNDELKIIDELYLQLKPEDLSKVSVTPEAMEITKIDLTGHLTDPETVTYEIGKQKLLDLLMRNKIKGKRKHFKPSGHNITFDENFIWEQLISKEEWSSLVHHNNIDTLRLVTILRDCGILPERVGSLTSLVEFFNIKMGEAHNAKEDIKMNIEVYKQFRNMLQSKKRDFADTTGNSLLKIIER
jgi:DNA polymerase III alpha subunit (gram-positive type)